MLTAGAGRPAAPGRRKDLTRATLLC